MGKIELLNLDRADEINEISMRYRTTENIYLYHKESEDDAEIITAIQKKKASGSYMDIKMMIAELKQVFADYTAKKIHVHVTPYQASPLDVVDAKYITDRMRLYKKSTKLMATDLDMTKAQISDMINGNQAIDSPTKAALYYYFKVQELLEGE
jgi:hypothetical protein